MRLSHAPKSGFGQFNHPIIMDDEIQAGVEEKAAGHGFGWAQVEVRPGRDVGDFTKEPFGFRHSSRASGLSTSGIFVELR